MINVQVNELYFVEDWNKDVVLLYVEEYVGDGVWKCRKLRHEGDHYVVNRNDTPYLVCQERFISEMKEVLTLFTEIFTF